MDDIYYTVIIPWEPNLELRTQWHPTSPVGTFNVLSRGAFPTEVEAQSWASTSVGKAPYTTQCSSDWA